MIFFVEMPEEGSGQKDIMHNGPPAYSIIYGILSLTPSGSKSL
jgi:hypothetical protein